MGCTELLIRFKDALISEKSRGEEKAREKYKKASVIPHSDLTLEWLHSIQPGREGCVSDRHVCVRAQTHGGKHEITCKIKQSIQSSTH